jgi:hypothetical protein
MNEELKLNKFDTLNLLLAFLKLNPTLQMKPNLNEGMD